MIKKHLPNAITCANLFTGCVAMVYAFNGDIKSSIYFIALSGLFDFFDGFAARLLHVKSAIGKELDSLADVISFGLLPSVIMFKLLCYVVPQDSIIPYFAFVIAIFSALRLAKFNIDTEQSENFKGLNTPTNAVFIASIPHLSSFSNLYLLLFTIALVCYLLVCNVKLFSLKFSHYAWSANKFKYIFLILSALSFSFLMFAAVPLILIFYFVFSTIHFKYST